MTFCARAEIVDLQTEEHLTYIQIYYMSFRWISDYSIFKTATFVQIPTAEAEVCTQEKLINL